MKEFVSDLGTEVEKGRRTDSPLFQSIRDRLVRVFGESLDLEAILDTIADVAARAPTSALITKTSPRLAYRFSMMQETNAPVLEGVLKETDNQIDGNAKMAKELLAFSTEYIRQVCGAAKTTVAAETYRRFLRSLSNAPGVDGLNAALNHDKVYLRTGEGVLKPLVATTNYDLCFEAFCAQYGVNYVNGFSHNVPEHEFDFSPELFDREAGIPLLKLHGSIDWWKTDSKRILESQYASPGKELRSGEKITDICIRYPVSDKQLFEYPFLELYSRLGRYLRRAQIWLFVGYSFGDPSVRNLVVDLARRDKKIIVVHPSADYILNNTLQLRGRIPGYAVRMKFPHQHCLDMIFQALIHNPEPRPEEILVLD